MSKDLKVYSYDAETGVLLGEGLADIDPLGTELKVKEAVRRHLADNPEPVAPVPPAEDASEEGVANYHKAVDAYLVELEKHRAELNKVVEAVKPAYLVPANSTTVEPPKAKKGKIALFDRQAKVWKQVDEPKPEEAPEPSDEELAAEARVKRNGLLAASDWTQLGDVPVDASIWKPYRQALRDVPQQAGFPKSINWPTEPK